MQQSAGHVPAYAAYPAVRQWSRLHMARGRHRE